VNASLRKRRNREDFYSKIFGGEKEELYFLGENEFYLILSI